MPGSLALVRSCRAPFQLRLEPLRLGLRRFDRPVAGQLEEDLVEAGPAQGKLGQAYARVVQPAHHGRSEEHTSELQSRPHLVCRLLLEKKKALASNAEESDNKVQVHHYMV